MAEPTELIVTGQTSLNERLDTYLRTHFPTVSRGTFQRLIEEQHVRVNDLPAKPSHRPRAGDRIVIHWPEPKDPNAQPEDIPLTVLYEDDDLLVVNKPPALVVHPAAGHDEHTLVNALLHHCAGRLSGIGGVARPGIVHRLDKDTSGCIVVAKNDVAHMALARQFARRDVVKIYDALVCGEMSRDTGDIRAAIARHPNHRKRMAVTDGGGRDAWTSYRVVDRFSSATLVEATLHTGRTHQIRVHFHHVGFPLVGDETYGPRQNARFRQLTGIAASRQMLHARSIEFTHPASGERLQLEAALPADFKAMVAALRKRTNAAAQ